MAHFFLGCYMLLFAASIYQIFNDPIEHVDIQNPTLVPSLPGNHLDFTRRWASDIVFSQTAAQFSLSPLSLLDLKPSLNALRIIAQRQASG
jgi:hypothetical protein